MPRLDLDRLKILAVAGAVRQARIRPYENGFLLEIDYGDQTSIVEKAHGGMRVFRSIDTPAKLLLQNGVDEVRVQAEGHWTA